MTVSVQDYKYAIYRSKVPKWLKGCVRLQKNVALSKLRRSIPAGPTFKKTIVMEEEESVLCVGLVCVDKFFVVKQYPQEDSDQPIQEAFYARGGNAANNCTVLAQCVKTVEFLGTLPKPQYGNYGLDSSRFSHKNRNQNNQLSR